MIRDLGHVVDREKAKIGIFITLAEPTKPMITEAIKAGFYETPYDKFPKLQIYTIRELFNLEIVSWDRIMANQSERVHSTA